MAFEIVERASGYWITDGEGQEDGPFRNWGQAYRAIKQKEEQSQ